MRVSTNLIHMQGVESILNKQAELLRLQEQTAIGKKILQPSDDPSGASRLIDLEEALSQIEQYDENINYATQRLNLEESSLDSSLLVLQRVRELSIQAANTGVNDLQSQQAIASEIKEKLEELLDYANTRDENGDYIFSGFQSKTQAFSSDGVGNYSFNGDQGQLGMRISSSRQVIAGDSGADIFQLVRTGNGDFSVDAKRTNSGTGRITTGSVVDRTAFQKNDYTLRFIDANNFEVINNTLGTVVDPATRAYAEGASINFDGIEVEISNTPVAGDEFTVQASRYQDVFTTLNNLVRELDKPGTGDLAGSFGGNYSTTGFAVGDTVNFDLAFDGVNLTVATVPLGATDEITGDNVIAALIAAGPVNVVDNLDGTATLNGSTPGLSVTFSVEPVTGVIQFRTAGGNGEISSNLTLNNLADGVANDATMSFVSSGNTVASTTSIATGDTGFFAAGEPSSSFLSQQIDNALNNIDRVMDSIINVQTSIGGRINSIENQSVNNETRSVKLQEVRADIQDLDLAAAISELTYQTTALQVAQQTFVRIQALSLFEFI